MKHHAELRHVLFAPPLEQIAGTCGIAIVTAGLQTPP